VGGSGGRATKEGSEYPPNRPPTEGFWRLSVLGGKVGRGNQLNFGVARRAEGNNSARRRKQMPKGGRVNFAIPKDPRPEKDHGNRNKEKKKGNKETVIARISAKEKSPHSIRKGGITRR